MSQSAAVVRNIFWLTLEPVIGALISISLAGFVASRLGLIGYGQFTFALSFVVLFSVIVNLGMSEVLLRAVAQRAGDESTLWSTVMGAKSILLVVYIGVAMVIAWAAGYGGRLTMVIGLMALFQGLLSLEQTTVSMFAGRQQFKPAVTIKIGKTLTDTTATVVVLLSGFSVVGLAFSRVIVAFVGLLALAALACWQLGLRPRRPSYTVIRPLIATGVTFSGISVLYAVSARGGVLVLERAGGFEAVALFSAAMSLVDRLLLFLPPVVAAVFPFFSALNCQAGERFSSSLARAIRYQMCIGTGLGLAIALLGPWVLHTFFPATFAGAIVVVEVLGMFAALRASVDLVNSAALARGLEKQVALSWGARCVVNLAGAAALAAGYGAAGLAWSMVAAEAVLLVLLLAVLARSGGLGRLRAASLIGAPASAAMLFFVSTFISGSPHTLLASLSCLGAYPALLAVTGVVSSEDRRYLTGLFRSSSPPAFGLQNP